VGLGSERQNHETNLSQLRGNACGNFELTQHKASYTNMFGGNGDYIFCLPVGNRVVN
jgi:hypothetical protein